MTAMIRSAIRAVSRGPILRGTFIAAIATALAFATAPASYGAQTEQEIKANCEGVGGEYFSHPNDSAGNRWSTCCYKDPVFHVTHCADYINGEYSPSAAPPPVSGPATPPANNAPIHTNPPQAH